MNWSYPELMACPDRYVAIIGEEAQREAREQDQRTRQHASRPRRRGR